MTVTRLGVRTNYLVDALVADKRLKYPEGKSGIAYIGTTSKGINRFARSVATQADDILGLRGVQSFRVAIVTYTIRPGIRRPWHKLERALLLSFRERYGQVPVLNRTGMRMKETNEFDYFSRRQMTRILEEIA